MAAIVTIMSLAGKPCWTHSVGQAPSALPACCSAETMLGLNKMRARPAEAEQRPVAIAEAMAEAMALKHR